MEAKQKKNGKHLTQDLLENLCCTRLNSTSYQKCPISSFNLLISDPTGTATPTGDPTGTDVTGGTDGTGVTGGGKLRRFMYRSHSRKISLHLQSVTKSDCRYATISWIIVHVYFLVLPRIMHMNPE